MTSPGPVFSGRIVLVTGASRGIGRAAALALAKAGAHVVAGARTLRGRAELGERRQQEDSSGTNVKANVFNPGKTRTRMRAEAMPGEDPMTLPTPEELTPQILELLSPACVKNGELVNFRR